jgi:ABC-type uncharacterized transport system auxiliary subunit
VNPSRPRRTAVELTLAAAAVGLVLSGCVGSLFKSKQPPQSVYLLSATPVSGGAAIPVDLAILRPQVRAGLDSTMIAALYPDHRLDHFAGARWSAPLDEVVQSLALEALQGRVRDVQTEDSAFGTGYWLEIEVADFQAEYAAPEGTGVAAPPTVHVRLVARLGASGDRRVLGGLEADVRERASDNRMTAIVDAYNRAASAAIAKIGAEAVEKLQGAGGPAPQ